MTSGDIQRHHPPSCVTSSLGWALPAELVTVSGAIHRVVSRDIPDTYVARHP